MSDGLLVTGGLGFVGSHFVWAAHEAGARVVVLDDRSGGEAAPLPDGVRVVTGDIGAAALVSALVRDERLGAMVHFAGKIQVGESVRAPRLYFDHNVARGLRLLDAALDAGVSRVVFSSTAAVYGTPEIVPIPESSVREPVNPYGASKLAFERVLSAYGDAYGLRWAAPRYFNAAGAHPRGHLVERHEPETHLIPLVLDAALGRRPALRVFGDDYPTPDGTCVRDYVHVCDLADAHLAALDALTRGAVGALNLGTGRGASVREVIDAAARALGRAVPFERAPRRDGDPAALVADASRAGALLGWRARRSELEVIVEDARRSRG
ncbi:MAG: UDP-glucose 4-epimerase GalE [Polyangiaceae bacterium]|nr:UDP-glucose 4-epimerase GalE [Polyangiaceae bacterium]